MARYIITKAAGEQFPVGFKFKSDDLHPAMKAHVRRIDVADDEPEPEDEPEGGEDEQEDEQPDAKKTRAPRQQGPGKNT